MTLPSKTGGPAGSAEFSGVVVALGGATGVDAGGAAMVTLSSSGAGSSFCQVAEPVMPSAKMPAADWNWATALAVGSL